MRSHGSAHYLISNLVQVLVMNYFRQFRTVVFVFAAIFASAIQASSQSDSLVGDLNEHFTSYKLATVKRSGDRMRLVANGEQIEISMTAHDLRAARYRAETTGLMGIENVERAPVNTFKGRLADGGTSRINVIDGKFEGYFEQNGRRVFFEPASRFSAAASDEYVVYSMDGMMERTPLACGASMVERAENFAKGNQEISSYVAGTKRIELAIDADFEYVNTLGSVNAANAEILGILNTIEGVYAGDLGLSISVVYQHAWTTPDPYAAANAELTVRNFQAHWNANAPYNTVPRDAAHLFSAKANVQSQGWAFIGVVCNNPSFAYGASGYISWAPGKHLITAHELAHNLGANHADAAQACTDSVMNAQLAGTTPLTFCQFSRNEVGNHVNSTSCVSFPNSCRNDFDGDSKAELAIFRPAAGEWWTLSSANGSNWAAQFGASTDRIVPADYTGDGKTDVAIFRPSSGNWFVLRSEDQTYYAFPFGTNGDTPVPDDFDADGRADSAVYRPSSGVWYINKSGGGTDIVTFGSNGDVPVNADYDGDGRSDIAIYRPSQGQWWIQRSTAGTTVWQFGNAADRTVPGDFTGDGKADVAIFRPSTGEWSVMRSEDRSFYSFPFGAVGDVPSPGDYDGDGKFDAAVFRPNSAIWYAQRSTAGLLVQQFGAAGDLPLASAYVR